MILLTRRHAAPIRRVAARRSSRLATAALLTALLCSCTSAGATAEKRYEMVKRTGTWSEICEASKAVMNAYLNAGDETLYAEWQLRSSGDCLSAQIYGQNARPSDPAGTQADDLSSPTTEQGR